MSLALKFRPAQRQACKASIMIEGLTGTGKSGLALMIARALTESWEKIYAVDTENQSLDLYEHKKLHTGEVVGAFNKVDLTEVDGFKPSNYQVLTNAAIAAGAQAVILDSISHMWTGKDGVLYLVEQVKNNNPKMDNYRVWGVPEVSKEKTALVHIIRNSNAHIITTVRVKEKFEMVYDESRKSNVVKSLGEQQIQQGELKYEPDLVLHMLEPGTRSGKNPKAVVIKSRYDILEKGAEYEFTPALLQQLKEYLLEGVDPEVLLAKQQADYCEAVTTYVGTNATRASIWNTIKQDNGYEKTKLEEIPLEDLKLMYQQLTS